MPLPTLLTKDAIDADTSMSAIDYITDWLSMRIIGGLRQVTILPTKAGDRVLLLESKTGSGKSTVLPPSIYIAFGMRKTVAVTQPRVISAVQTPFDIMKFFPELIMEDNLGYQTGSITRRARSGLIFMTIGVLYQQLKVLDDEQIIKKYKVIIIDEVHERSIDLDLTLSLIKQFLERNWKNPECPFVILTSATFDIESLRRYFDTPTSHIIKVAGARAYEIEDNYLTETPSNYVEKIIDIAMDIHTKNAEDYRYYFDEVKKGRPPSISPNVDIIVFVSGVGDMDTIIDEINTRSIELNEPMIALKLNSKIYSAAGTEYKSILSTPLYELKMPNDESKQAYRRVIISTDVAQTSVTIETLKYCIDAGIRNFVSWNPDVNSVVSIISHIPKSSAIQRKGRVGRVAPGRWFPCFTKKTFESMEDNSYPDIVTSNIISGVLTMIILDEEFDVSKIDLINSIPSSSLRSALEELYMLGCIKYKEDGKIMVTEIGKIINTFPIIPPSLGRLILAGYEHGVNIKLLITMASIMNFNGNIFGRRYEIGTEAQVHNDDYIDAVDKFYEFMNVLTKSYSSENKDNNIEDWCKKNSITYGKELFNILDLRDRLIQTIYTNKLTFNMEYPEFIVNIASVDEYDKQIVSIKSCLRDALTLYRLNYTGKHNLYRSHYRGILVEVDSRVIKQHDDENKGRIIITNGFKFGKNKQGKFVFNNMYGASIMDGYVEIDDTLALN